MNLALIPLACAILLMAVASPAGAADATTVPPAGLGRLHSFQDWVMGCDNTLRCQAQGYPAEADAVPDQAMAVLVIERAAGPGRLPRLRFEFGQFDGQAVPPRRTDTLMAQAGAQRIRLQLALRDGAETWVPADGAPALLAWVRQGQAIALSAGPRRWRVSLAGASAALLKMDELQGRLGTPGALMRPGTRSESTVPAPPPPPVVAARVPATTAQDGLLEPRLRAALGQPYDNCPDFDPQQPMEAPVRVNARQLLVVQPCWRGAYQTGSRLRLVDDRPPHRVQPVALPAANAAKAEDSAVIDGLSVDAQGRLTVHAAAKGRGVGDCWSVNDWVWTGQGLALVSAEQSACKAFEAGGLPITLWRTRASR